MIILTLFFYYSEKFVKYLYNLYILLFYVKSYLKFMKIH